MRKIDIVYDLILIASWFAIILMGARIESINHALKNVIEKQQRMERIWSDGGL